VEFYLVAVDRELVRLMLRAHFAEGEFFAARIPDNWGRSWSLVRFHTLFWWAAADITFSRSRGCGAPFRSLVAD